MSTMKVTFLPRYRWHCRVFCRIINQVPLQIDSGGGFLRMDLSLAWLLWISPFNWRIWSHKTTSKDSPSVFLTGVPNVLHLCEIVMLSTLSIFSLNLPHNVLMANFLSNACVSHLSRPSWNRNIFVEAPKSSMRGENSSLDVSRYRINKW